MAPLLAIVVNLIQSILAVQQGVRDAWATPSRAIARKKTSGGGVHKREIVTSRSLQSRLP